MFKNSATSAANSSGSWSGAGILPPGRSTSRAWGRCGASFSASGAENGSWVGLMISVGAVISGSRSSIAA